MKRLLLTSLRVTELAGGAATILSGLGIFLYLVLSPGPDEDKTILTWLLMFLFFVVPAVVVALGCYLQAARRTHWPILVVIGGGVCVYWTATAIGNAFVYWGCEWGLRMVYAELGALLATVFVALLHTLVLAIISAELRQLRAN